jgi:hypothetical protein
VRSESGRQPGVEPLGRALRSSPRAPRLRATSHPAAVLTVPVPASTMPEQRVNVFVRARGLSDKEVAEKCISCVTVHPEARSIVAGSGFRGDGGLGSTAKERAKPTQYTFQGVFGPSASQRAVYSQVVEPLVSSFLGGFNSTIMAVSARGGRGGKVSGCPV